MGNRQARWMIVGEAPGEQEDKQGLPFVGPAGQLLDAMLAAMGLTREADVYIANVIKCRPPHNRNPEPAEVAQCRPYLQRQIELVQPDLILALGRFAAQTLLAGVLPDVDKLPLGKLRGQVYRVDGRPVVVSYHPAYLLRSPAEKGKAWADLCLAMEALGHNPLAPSPQAQPQT
jgi:DNA polymerase